MANKLKDLTGKTFGKLTVIGRAEKNKGNVPHWHCKCECGNETIVSGHNLKVGLTKSCGCYRKERAAAVGTKFQDLTGKTFSKLTVIGRAESGPNGNTRWHCKCECGNEVTVQGAHLKNGLTKSCGCYRKERAPESNRIHGQYKTRLYRIWARMKTRCLTPGADNYRDYGGRGITICDDWKDNFQSFYDWAVSHGYNDELTIDRIDVNGNYEPSNCRWATRREQSDNTRRTIRLTIDGQTHTINEWSEISGLPRTTIYNRYRNFWPTDRLLERVS